MKTSTLAATPKKKVGRAKQIAAIAAATATSSPVPVSTTLSAPVSELVRWYGSITRHREGATVEGAVFGVLARAKETYEDPHGGDEAFNWLMEDVLAGMNSLERKPACRRYDGGVTIQLSVEASELLHRALQADEDARDVVSGCVESMLGCALDGTDLSYNEAIIAARERRLACEREVGQKLAAIRSWHQAKNQAAAAAGKEVVA